MSQTDKNTIAGIVLAGGQGSRMGGVDKAFVMLDGKPLIAHVIERARPQVDEILISANGDSTRFADFGARVLVDDDSFGSVGPLSGLFTALKHLRSKQSRAGWLALFACDTPFFPEDLIAKLHAAALRENASVAIPASGGRVHPVFALVRSDIAVSPDALQNLGARKAESWLTRFAHVRVDFASGAIDPFFNLNTPDDLSAAEAFLRARRNG